jgi:hypothetical protein
MLHALLIALGGLFVFCVVWVWLIDKATLTINPIDLEDPEQ